MKGQNKWGMDKVSVKVSIILIEILLLGLVLFFYANLHRSPSLNNEEKEYVPTVTSTEQIESPSQKDNVPQNMGAEIASQKTQKTTLLKACQKGDLKVVKALLSQGASVEEKNNDGWTPLMVACFHGHYEVVKVLLAHGANIEAKNNGGRPPLMLACFHGHDEVVKVLLAQGANIEAKAIVGMTPLMWACFIGHDEVVKVLLAHGADIDAKDKYGSTALDFAQAENHKEIIDLLQR